MKRYKTYQYRIYPTSGQADLIERTFGCCRFVYNYYLEHQTKNYESGGAYLSKTKTNNHCNRMLKDEYPFLRDVDKFAITNAIWNLDAAFQGFFKKRTGYPKFKSKRHSKRSYQTNYSNGNIVVLENAVKLPKLGAVKAVVHRSAPADWKLKSATVFQKKSGAYYCSVLFEYEFEEKNRQLDLSTAIGLDYKSDGLYVSDSGSVCGSPKYYLENQKKLSWELKKLSRKKPGSKNYEKQRLRVAKQYEHIANKRKDFLHKEALSLAMNHDVVIVEDLDMRNMAQKPLHIGKATMDNAWGMFVYMLEYKLEERGKQLIKVDKFFPSSQLCTLCGQQNKKVRSLSVREWECPVCHAIHNRDINAAENIRREGVRLYWKTQQQVA